MRIADSDYILALHNGARVVNYAVFTLANGTILNLQPSDFRVTGNSYTDKTTDSNAFSVGSFIGKTANICIDNSDGKFDGYDFYMSRFVLREAIQINATTVKHVTIGEFTVVTDYTPGRVLNFSAVDASYKFDKAHNLTGFKTFKEIISLACNACLGSSTFDGTGNFSLYNTYVNTSKLDAKLTWRQLVSYVAIACGYNAYIDEIGLLKFKWYDTSVWNSDDLDGGTFKTNTMPYSDGDTADGGDFTFSESTDYDGGLFTDTQDYHIIQTYKNFQIGTYDISITGVRVVNGESVVENSSSHDYGYSYIIEVKDNPLCESIQSTIANHLASKLLDFTFRTFSCSVLCDPLIEAGDMALVIDTKGIKHRTLINSVDFSTGGYTHIACQAESIIRQQASYTSEAAKAVVEANRHTDDTLSSYDESVQRMNRLAQNATGLYDGRVRQSDGSYINYISDHQITYWPDGSVRFVQHSFVAKETGDGYFYSTDSGTSDLGEYSGSVPTTWTGGLDKNGNAVLNTLSVYGLSADWLVSGTIRTSLITALDSTTTVDGKTIDEIAQEKADEELTSWINGDYATDKNNLQNQIDRRAETYYQSTDPSINWVNTANGLTIKFDPQSATEAGYDFVYIYYKENEGNTYSYYRQSGQMGAISINIPATEFWVHWHTDNSQHDYWGWKIEVIEDYEGSSYTPPYATGAALPSITATDKTLSGLQSDHPYTDNVDVLYHTITKANHKGDLWYRTTDDTTWYYNGTEWVEQEVPKAVFDEIDGKAQIYTSQPVPPYNVGDLWFANTSSEIKVCVNAKATGSFVSSDWAKRDKYTDDTAVTALNNSLDQTEVFNRLIGGDTAQGIVLNNGKLYLRGDYLEAGAITVGGSAFSTNPTLVVKDTGNQDIVRLNVNEGIWAQEGTIGDLTLEDGELHGDGEYLLKDTKTWNEGKSSLGGGHTIITDLIPRDLRLSKPFKISVDYTVSDLSKTNTRNFRFELHQRSGNTDTTVAQTPITEVEGSYTALLDYSISNTDTYNYAVWVMHDFGTTKFKLTTRVYIDDVSVVSLSRAGIYGTFTGTVFGVGNFDSLSADTITVDNLQITDNGIVRTSDDDAYMLDFTPTVIRSRNSSTQYTRLDNSDASLRIQDTANSYIDIMTSTPEINVYKSSSEYIRIKGNNPSIHIQDSSSEYLEVTGHRLRANTNSNQYVEISDYPTIKAYATSENFINISADDKKVQLSYDSTHYVIFQGGSNKDLLDRRGSNTYSIAWTSSDRRNKENIEDLDVELSKNFIDATETKQFKYKDSEGKHYGMIAQDVRELLDSLGETDAHLEYCVNEEDEYNPRNINYQEYIPHLINYVKMLNEKVEAQESRINQLEEEIKILKGDK